MLERLRVPKWIDLRAGWKPGCFRMRARTLGCTTTEQLNSLVHRASNLRSRSQRPGRRIKLSPGLGIGAVTNRRTAASHCTHMYEGLSRS